MPLDTSAYSLGLLRVDGRRWNDLRRMQARLRTQDAADGSSYLEMGHTKVMGVVSGPEELLARRGGLVAGGGGALLEASASVVVHVVVAGFAGVDRKRRGRNDRRIQEMEITIARTFSSVIHTHLFPHSTITISLHVLSTDGSLLAALFNAATLALIDAGVPMADYVSACTSGSTVADTDISTTTTSETDPILDLNAQEELELPFLTLATVGEGDKVAALVCESRLHVSLFEPLLAVGLDGCRQVRALLDEVVGERGRRMIRDGVAPKGDVLFAEVDG
ncbi:hypothetical protein CP533_0004 [Ophiocordyceps camponoti-saundersi (nom. inval.)]|nr:hypothetical protein CP533_0004 [Ophiocordyceps camponoti-saundersi (nom. inval.)]